MAIPQASQIQVFDREFMRDYVRDSSFLPFMGRAGTRTGLMPIVSRYELTDGGKTINVPLIMGLGEGGGVQGRTRLAGNERELDVHNHALRVNWNREGVVILKPDEHATGLQLRNAAKMGLNEWAAISLRNDVIASMLAYDAESIVGGVNTVSPGGRGGPSPLQTYLARTEAQKDAWLAANADRYLFGAAVSNAAGNDHSAALASLDDVNDRMTTNVVSLARSVARQTTRRLIRPYRMVTGTNKNIEQYVLFVGPRAFTDIKRDPAMQQANRDARIRGVDNPIFTDDDLIWDGVLIREIPEIPVIPGVGANGVPVEPAFLCGAQAIGVAWGQEPKSRVKKEDDYEFERGVAVEECRGVAKLVFNGIQHGMVNVFVAAPGVA